MLAHDRSRAVTESALMAALSFLFYVGTFVPVLAALCVFICPVPLTFVGVRHGARRAMHACLVAAVLVFALAGGFPSAFLFLSSFGSFGVASGWILTRQGPPGRALVMATLALALVSAPTFFLAGKGLGIDDHLPALEKQTFEMLDMQAKMVNDPALTAALPQIKKMLSTLLVCPLILFVMAALTGLYLNHVVAYQVFKRMAFTVRPPPNPYHLRLPPWAPALIILAFLRLGAIGGPNGTMEASLLLNVAISGVYLAWFAGIAALARMWSPKEELPVSRYLLLVLVGSLFGTIPALVGLFDAFQPPVDPAVNPPVAV